jgi:hypothetical protein
MQLFLNRKQPKKGLVEYFGSKRNPKQISENPGRQVGSAE